MNSMSCIKRSFELAAVLLALLMLCACAAAPSEVSAEKLQKQVFAMDTVMILTCYGDHAQEALDAGEAIILALDADFDPENSSGSVYAVNHAAGSAVSVSEDCISVLGTAMEIYGRTGGALDVGIYPLTKLWGFVDGGYRVPSPEEIAWALLRPDTGSIVWDVAAQTVTLPPEGSISFGAVAKGYTAQKVLDAMAQAGAEHAILSLGGNVQTLGQTKPDGSLWSVAITDPRDTGDYVGTLQVGQTAVVTSGGYQRYFEQDGVTYIHILDPQTGYPVDNGLLSLTVITEDGAEADALSTALFVLGEQGALDYRAQYGDIELVMVTEDDRVIVTAGAAAGFTENADGYTYVYPEDKG